MANNNVHCHLSGEEEIAVELMGDGKTFMVTIIGKGGDLTIFPDSAEQLQELAFAIESVLQDADLDLEIQAKKVKPEFSAAV